MSRRFDTHVHTTFSPDGRDGLEAYARRVDGGTLDGIGFTEHYEFFPESEARGFFREEDYFAAVAGWRDRGYPFFAGVEADWMPAYATEMKEHLNRHRFSHVIGSVHNLPSASVSGPDIGWTEVPTVFDRVLQEYYDQVASSLAVDEFDVIGHVGVWGRHLGPEFGAGPWRPRVEELEDALAVLLARSDKLLEVNTSGLFCARKAPCAGAFLLERYRVQGGRTLSLGSDAHSAADLGRGFREAAEQIARLGFDRVYLPWDRENPVPLTEYLR